MQRRSRLAGVRSSHDFQGKLLRPERKLQGLPTMYEYLHSERALAKKRDMSEKHMASASYFKD